jgi:hypothetical protein
MNKLLIILMLSVAFVFSANAQVANYVGSYEFSEDGGRTAGGTAIFVGHELKINADGTGRLTAAGYQTSKEVFVKTKAVGKKLQVIFEKYDEDGTNSFTPFKGGEILLTIEYKTVKKKKVLWTTFGEYNPVVFDAKKGGGIYFKKSK